MILGDGSIHNITKGCVLQFTHQEKQKDYIEHKARRVNSILGGKQNTPKKYESTTAFGKVVYYKYGKSHKYCKTNEKCLLPIW
jgi:mitochondrial fission protein ELM1